MAVTPSEVTLQDPAEICRTLRIMLTRRMPPLKVRHDRPDLLEVAGTKETQQGRQKVDGIFFASVVPKAKDVRFYFFPIYTHPAEFEFLSADLRKNLKGKSCFHIQKLSPEVRSEIQEMIERGIRIYQDAQLI
jgi:hypothetical protein